MLLQALQAAVPPGTDLSQLNTSSDRERAYREREFCAYLPVAEVRKRFKIGNYSAYENPTGIFFRAGETVRLTMDDAAHGTIRFLVRDFREGGGEQQYNLIRGENTIQIKRSGLGYIDYRSPLGHRARPVSLRISGGVINGVFSHHDNAATWKKLLQEASAGILDVMGERCQLAFDVEGLRKGNPEKGPEMVALYDRMVGLQQQLMGWDREGIHPGNHLLCRVIWSGYMQADGGGAAFNVGTIPGICDPDNLPLNSWGVAHEQGHVHQMAPSFCWAGLMEISNNLFSAWCNYHLNRKQVRMEHEVSPNTEGRHMRGGRFDCYVNHAIVKRHLWQFIGGTGSGDNQECGADLIVNVCPLWQLLLYFHEAQGKEDFYPNIFGAMRRRQDGKVAHGKLRLDFCRLAGRAAGCDLGPFFLQTGMVAPMNRVVADYSSHMMTISEEMIEQALREFSRQPKAESSVIYYITSNSVGIYRDRAEVRESPDFRPDIPEEGGDIVFPADKWENAVAFEVYEGKKLRRICLRGLGQEDDASTTVICPPGCNRIRAVQWDGKRYTVTEREATKSKGEKSGKKKKKKKRRR